MNGNEKEARKQNRLETLGSNNPVCIICGENDWRTLEQHHIAGQAYGEELCNVCRNCHRKLSDDQKEHPKQIGKPATNFETIGHLLLGLADFLALLVEKLRECGQFLIQAAQAMAGAV
jgi:hypothetical protein